MAAARPKCVSCRIKTGHNCETCFSCYAGCFLCITAMARTKRITGAMVRRQALVNNMLQQVKCGIHQHRAVFPTILCTQVVREGERVVIMIHVNNNDQDNLNDKDKANANATDHDDDYGHGTNTDNAHGNIFPPKSTVWSSLLDRWNAPGWMGGTLARGSERGPVRGWVQGRRGQSWGRDRGWGSARPAAGWRADRMARGSEGSDGAWIGAGATRMHGSGWVASKKVFAVFPNLVSNIWGVAGGNITHEPRVEP